jgi:hypothetical protein
MSARSRLSSVALVVCSLSALASESTSTTWSIEMDRTLPTKHGLYEIQQEAKKFVSRENERRGTDFVVGEPDLRIVVPKCAVPLSTKWGKPIAPERIFVATVTCRKTVPENYGKTRWAVDVSVFRSSLIKPASAPSPR